MMDQHKILSLLDGSRAGRSLPQALYIDPQVYEFDVAAVFPRAWLMIGFEAELPESGSYIALTFGSNPIVVVRGRDGVIRAFHNVCRHRGSQICEDGHGRNAKLICPYHKWTYDLDGRLIGAAKMGAQFRPEENALRPVAVRLLAGCIYVSLSNEAPDFAPFEMAIAPLLAPYRLAETKLAFQSTLVERANWKLVMENARECYHCPTGHPELRAAFPVVIEPGFTFGGSEHTREYAARMSRLGLSTEFVCGSWWQGGRYPLNPGMESLSMDGKPVVSRRLIDVQEREIGGFRWATEPNSFCHVLPEYAFMFSAIPVAPQQTIVISKWLVHRDAVEGIDYTVEGLSEIWTKTNLQDRALAENNQRGVNSVAYSPGLYSEQSEDLVIRFANWYRTEARFAAQALS
jgi:glycine betaine catabolism A